MKTKIYKKLLAGCLSAALVGTLVLAPAAPVSFAAEADEAAEEVAAGINEFGAISSDESALLGDDEEGDVEEDEEGEGSGEEGEGSDEEGEGSDEEGEGSGEKGEGSDEEGEGSGEKGEGSGDEGEGGDTGETGGEGEEGGTEKDPEIKKTYKKVDPDYNISMTKATVEFDDEDDPEFEVLFPDDDEYLFDVERVVLKISNPKVAKFDDDGNLEIIGIGQTTLTASNIAYEEESYEDDYNITIYQYQARKVSKTLTVIPAKSESVSVTALSNGIKITWSKVRGATGYKLYRSDSKTKPVYTGSKNTYSDTKATSGKSYTYYVVATANGQTGKASARSKSIKWVKKTSKSSTKTSAKTTALGKPSKVKAASKKSKTLLVSWKAAAGAKKYQVQYSTKSSFAGAKTKSASGTSLTISKLKGKTVYYVRVRAVSGKSYSDWVSGKKVTVKK